MFDLSRPLIDILQDLICIKSETGEEKALCDKLEQTLEGYEGRLVRERDSLIFYVDCQKESRVALVGHIDTVPVDDSSTEPVIKDGELWGRGACDMKSGLAVMLKVIYDLSTGKIRPKHNLAFIFYENEEGVLPNGINFLLESGKVEPIDFAFVLEPTEGRYSVGCLGALSVKKTVYGVSAHSANPIKGKNALLESMEIFQNMVTMNDTISAPRKLDGLEYYETVNITTLKTANQAFNVIPAQVDMTANFRFAPGKSLEDAMEELWASLGKENTEVLDSSGSCYIGASGEEFLLPGIEREIMQAWTDIAQLNNNDIPAVNFGAGSILHAHKPDERISVDELNDFYGLMVNHLQD
ncbi:MAG: M20/M25/M40 family metallo-hydrolase [Spirochaetales bacterium]|nr:M20/M25/M40 family metallo-hydrolase [Spirochaetales bacterium]